MSNARGKPPIHHFTDEQAHAFAARYASGEPAKSIAAEVGCSAQTIRRLLQRENAYTERRSGPRSRYSVEQTKVMIDRYAAGESLAAIARDFGCTSGNVRFILRARGVPLRAAGRPPVPDDKLDWLVAQRRLGRTFKDIAAELNVSTTHVAGLCRRLGLAPDPRGLGRKSPAWRGGIFVHGSGYLYEFVEISDPLYAEMATAMGYIAQHRLVMARFLGRPLRRTETVHHINGDKTDNRLENLQLRQGNHGKGSVMQCLDCGSANVGHVALADDEPATSWFYEPEPA